MRILLPILCGVVGPMIISCQEEKPAVEFMMGIFRYVVLFLNVKRLRAD